MTPVGQATQLTHLCSLPLDGRGDAILPATPKRLAARPASAILWIAPRGVKEVVLQQGSRTEQEKDLNWHAILGMMALMLVSFGLYGAAVGTYFTLTS